MKNSSVFAILTALLPTLLWPHLSAAQTLPQCEYNHTIQSGESLGSIAENYYGDAGLYERIVEATNLHAAANSVYTTINSPNTVEPGWLVCIPADTDPATGPKPVPPGLSVVELANIAYQLQWLPAGTVKLVNGLYGTPVTPDSATQTIVVLTNNIAYGAINGQNVAAAILATSPGDGIYYDLALVANQAGQPVNLDTVALGNQAVPMLVQVQDNTILLVVRARGANDPPCCPSQLMLQVYALRGGELTQVASQLIGTLDNGQAVPVNPERVLPEPASLSQDTAFIKDIQSAFQDEQPYDNSLPSSPTGHPEHVAFLFDDEARLRIYPLAEYEAQWNAAGDPTITTIANQLRNLLTTRPAFLYPALPILPPQNGINDLATQLKYLDFDGGSGVRFVGRVTGDASPVGDSSPVGEASPVTGNQLNYYFQGLTTNGQYLVSFIHPISAPLIIPADVTRVASETLQLANTDFELYHQTVTNALNTANQGDFSPNLAKLDALIQALAIVPEATAVTTSTTPVANVNSVTVENRAGQIIAVVQGQHPDNCHQLAQPTQVINGNVIAVTLPLAPPQTDGSCAQVITPYSIQLLVDTGNLTPGNYVLNVNGVVAEFTLP